MLFVTIISRGFWPPCLPDLKHVTFFVRRMTRCVHYNNHQGFKIIWSKAFGMSCLQFQQNPIMQWAYIWTHVCKPKKGVVFDYILFIFIIQKENISSMNMVRKSLPLSAIMRTLTDGKVQCWWALHSLPSCKMIWM